MRSNVLKTALVVLSVLFLVSCAGSPAPEPQEEAVAETSALPEPTLTVSLYPQGQEVDFGIVEDGVQVTLGPGESNGITEEEFFWPSDNTWNYVTDARILVFLPENHDGRMILMCPGGGYGSSLTTGSEGYFAAAELTRLGHAVALLLYRMPNKHHMVPLTDAQNAMRYCRHHASEWGVRWIGVMGGSAGGHLASSVSTLYVDEVTRPDFSILDYPVISTAPELKYGGSSIKRLTDRNPALLERYSAEKQVTPDTPPALIFHSLDDRAVNTEHSLRYFKALRAAGVRAEICIFPYGGHGWGFNTVEHAGEDRLRGYRQVYFDFIEAFLGDVAPV